MTEKEIRDLIPVIPQNVRFIQTDDLDYIIELADNNYKVRIKKDLYNYLLLIDGVQSLEELTKIFNSQSNFNLSVEYFYDLLTNKLGVFKFISQDKEVNIPKRTYLHLRYILIGEKVVDKIVTFSRFLFNKYTFISIIIFSFLFICFHNIYNISILNNYIENAKSGFIILTLFLIVLNAIIHELGHASACKYFGAQQNGIGFGFYLFTPVLFTDVSDAWKLNKRRRIVVNLGGIYFELIFNSLILITYYITGFKPLLILPAYVITKFLFDLNPFLRYDGYWILSDIVEIPNLRNQSYKKIKEFVSKIKERKLNFSGKDYFLFFYGIISSLIIISFIVYITVVNPSLILEGWKHLYNLIMNLIISNSIIYNFEEIFFKIFIPFIFYVMIIKYLLSFFKFKK